MSRLLLIQCPVNPKVLNPVGVDDLDFATPAERFRWCLLEQETGTTPPRMESTGQGAIASLPFADEALVLMPTVDVRLIHTRVPLITGKKLEALLPTLAEPYLMDQRTALRYQLLPPCVGAIPTERTIAVISETWMQWLEIQLAALPVRRVSMIPDCFLLDLSAKPTDDTADGGLCLVDRGDHVDIMAVRNGDDWGAGWVEFRGDQAAEQPGIPFDWAWLAPRASAWLSTRQSINLMLRRPAKTAPRSERTAARWQPRVTWSLWRQPAKYAAICAAVYLTGSILYMGALALSHWRWNKSIDAAARQNLSSPLPPKTSASLAYVRQATEHIHAQGAQTAGDFIPMASKLRSLLAAYPSGLLESVTYQPDGLRFRLRNTRGTPPARQVQKRARQLDMAVISLGRNEYQLLPYAGLLGSTATGEQP